MRDGRRLEIIRDRLVARDGAVAHQIAHRISCDGEQQSFARAYAFPGPQTNNARKRILDDIIHIASTGDRTAHIRPQGTLVWLQMFCIPAGGFWIGWRHWGWNRSRRGAGLVKGCGSRGMLRYRVTTVSPLETKWDRSVAGPGQSITGPTLGRHATQQRKPLLRTDRAAPRRRRAYGGSPQWRRESPRRVRSTRR